MVVATFPEEYWAHYGITNNNNNSEILDREGISRRSQRILELVSVHTGVVKMAEGSSRGAAHGQDIPNGLSGSSTSIPPSSRSRPKLGRSSTLNWFNKSFDQTSLKQETKTSKRPQMRRQSSVSDFFQSMLSRGKSHIVGILSSKRDKGENHTNMASTLDTSEQRGESCSPTPTRVSRASIEFSVTSAPHQTDTSRIINSSESFPEKTNSLSQAVAIQSSNEAGKANHVKHGIEASSPTDNFIVRRNIPDGKNESHPPSSLVMTPFQSVSPTHLHDPSKFVGASKTPSNVFRSSTFASPKANRHPLVSRKASLQSQRSVERRAFKETADDMVTAKRAIFSAPAGRTSHSGTHNNLMVEDATSIFKRALVKSSSETFHTKKVDQQPLAKASSDGNCFKKGSTLSLDSPNAVISRITNYLYLGSIEAAYSEPLLCKNKITSLIDMTNMSSTDVPLHKKTDCPCACITKNHFRSRLNIGVDDIEWENMAQYYDVINAFINGARKKGGRILIFSYMGQSRAAAATIQHLMYQYKIPFNEAYHLIKSKRPQTKINSGFIKALRQLEKTLGLPDKGEAVNDQDPASHGQRSEDKASDSTSASTTSDDSAGGSSFPPVVRGAWLEC